MLKLTRKSEYGLIALLHIDSQKDGELVTAKEIAETYQLPAELLGKVLQSLAREGLVESVQGSKGGYRLGTPIESVSLGEVIEKLEGPIVITPCCDGSLDCRQVKTCNIHNPVQRIQEEVREFFYTLSLSKFRSDPVVRGLTGELLPIIR
jgi:Rrf2 family protein